MSTGWKKWECPPDMFSVEERLRTLQLTDEQTDRMALSYFEVEMKKTKDPEMRQKWAALFVKTQAKIIKKELKEGFVEDFQLWLQGRSKYCQPTIKIPTKDKTGKTTLKVREATPWGNKGLLHLDEVRNWLKKPILNRDKVIKKVAELKLGPLKTIEDCWLFYKYITRGVAVDGDVIKEQRSYNVFDYMESAPTKIDADGHIVPDDRYKPLHIENPSMPRFDKDEYDRIYTTIGAAAMGGDASVVTLPEYDMLMPGDKLMILSLLAEREEGIVPLEPAISAAYAFVSDIIAERALKAKAPIPPVRLKEEADDKEYDEAVEKEERRLAEEAKKKKKKVVEEGGDPIDHVAELMKFLETPLDEAEILEESLSELEDELSTSEKELEDEFEKDTYVTTKKLDMFGDLHSKLEAYRILKRELTRRMYHERYEPDVGKFDDINEIDDDRDPENVRETGTNGIYDWFVNIANGKDEMNKNLATRATMEVYFTDFFHGVQRMKEQLEGADVSNNDILAAALNDMPPVTEYRKRLTDNFDELVKDSDIVRVAARAVDTSDALAVRELFSGLARLSYGMNDPKFLREGISNVRDALHLATNTSEAGEYVRRHMLATADRVDAIVGHYEHQEKSNGATGKYLETQGASMQIAYLDSLFMGDKDKIKKYMGENYSHDAYTIFESIKLPPHPIPLEESDHAYIHYEPGALDEFRRFIKEGPDAEKVENMKRDMVTRMDVVKTLMRMPSEGFINRLEQEIPELQLALYRKKASMFDLEGYKATDEVSEGKEEPTEESKSSSAGETSSRSSSDDGSASSEGDSYTLRELKAAADKLKDYDSEKKRKEKIEEEIKDMSESLDPDTQSLESVPSEEEMAQIAIERMEKEIAELKRLDRLKHKIDDAEALPREELERLETIDLGSSIEDPDEIGKRIKVLELERQIEAEKRLLEVEEREQQLGELIDKGLKRMERINEAERELSAKRKALEDELAGTKSSDRIYIDKIDKIKKERNELREKLEKEKLAFETVAARDTIERKKLLATATLKAGELEKMTGSMAMAEKQLEVLNSERIRAHEEIGKLRGELKTLKESPDAESVAVNKFKSLLEKHELREREIAEKITAKEKEISAREAHRQEQEKKLREVEEEKKAIAERAAEMAAHGRKLLADIDTIKSTHKAQLAEIAVAIELDKKRIHQERVSQVQNAARNIIDSLGGLEETDMSVPFNIEKEYRFRQKRTEFKALTEHYKKTTGMDIVEDIQSIGKDGIDINGYMAKFLKIKSLVDREAAREKEPSLAKQYLNRLDNLPVNDDKFDISPLGDLVKEPEIAGELENIKLRREGKIKEFVLAKEQREIESHIASLAKEAAKINDLESMNKLALALANPKALNLINTNQTINSIAKLTYLARDLGNFAAQNSMEKKLAQDAYIRQQEEINKLKGQITVIGNERNIAANKVKEGVDIELQGMQQRFVDLLGAVHAGSVEHRKGKEFAKVEYEKLEEMRTNNITKERSLDYSIRVYSRERDEIHKRMEEISHFAAAYNAHAAGKEKLDPAQFETAKKHKEEFGKLAGDVYNILQRISTLTRQKETIRMTNTDIMNMTEVYKAMFMEEARQVSAEVKRGRKPDTRPPVMELEWDSNTRTSTFSQTQTLLDNVNKTANLYGLSGRQLGVLSDSLRGALANIDKYKNNMDEREASLRALLSHTIESIDSIGSMGTASRASMAATKPRKDMTGKKIITGEKDERYYRSKAAGEFAPKAETLETRTVVAESLIKQINKNRRMGDYTNITQAEHATVNWYVETYGRGAGVRLTRDPKINIVEDTPDLMLESQNKLLGDKTQKALVEYAKQVSEGKASTAINPIQELLSGFLMAPSDRETMDPSVEEQRALGGLLNYVQSGIEQTIVQASRAYGSSGGNPNPNIEQLAKLLQDYPEQAKKAIADGYVVRLDERTHIAARAAEEQQMHEILEIADDDSPEALDEKQDMLEEIYESGFDDIDEQMNILSTLSDAGPVNSPDKTLATMMDGFMYERHTGELVARQKAGINEAMYNEFIGSFQTGPNAIVEKEKYAASHRLNLLSTNIRFLSRDGEYNAGVIQDTATAMDGFIGLLTAAAYEINNDYPLDRDMTRAFEHFKSDMEIIKVRVSALSNEGMRVTEGSRKTLNETYGIKPSEVYRKLSLSSMYKWINLNRKLTAFKKLIDWDVVAAKRR